MYYMIYLYTLATLVIIDVVWLFSTGALYKKWLGHLFASTVNFTPVVIFYLVYVFGIAYFVVMPAVRAGEASWSTFITGAIFGAIAYATYDLTNQATLKGWPVHVTLIDLVWGSLLTGAVGVIALAVFNYFK